MSTPLRAARGVIAVAVVCVLIALPACTSSPTPPTPPPSVGPTRSADAADLRERLVHGLQVSTPAGARLVGDAATVLTAVEAPWLTGWQIVDVLNGTAPHPRRMVAALSDAGEAVVLTGHPEAFSTVLQSAGVRVHAAEVAAAVATVFLDSTRTFSTLSYRVEDAADIHWRPTLTATEQATRAAILSAVAERIGPARAAQGSAGWVVESWTVSGFDLVRHQTTIDSAGRISDDSEAVASDLPVPASR